MKKIKLLIVNTCLCIFSIVSSAFAQSLPPAFVSELVSTNWNQLTGFTFDPLKRLYVYEKEGFVWTVDSNGVKASTPLLNLREEVGGWRDHGLNGLALDPDFLTNGYLYLMYTVDRHHLMKFGTPQYNASTDEYFAATIIRVTRYQVDVANGNFNSIVPGSRFVLIGSTRKNGIPLLHESHSGGQIFFGDDKTLLISTGDGASYNVVDGGSSNDTYWAQALTDSIIRPAENCGSFRSQLVNCLAGKILRIDRMTGAGLPTNPFYNPANPFEARSLVWALGLRNPYRTSFRVGSGSADPTAGDPGTLYIGDVGWTQWEDLHVCDRPGLNFGWPIYEGMNTNSGYLGANTANLDAPNPLFGIAGCTQQFFLFKDLIKQETRDTTVRFFNPCNTALRIPANIPVFFHSRPEIDYIHGNQSRCSAFNGLNPVTFDLDNPSSPVPGPRFGGAASTAGDWYTSDRFPFIYQNTYFHSDYVGGWIRNFVFDANDNPVQVRNFATNLGPVVFIKMNPFNGTLMYVKYPNEIRRIRYSGNINNPPRAVIQKDKIFGSSPLTVAFDASFSSDPENLPLTYNWNFRDGSPVSNQLNPVKTFTAPGTQSISYWVVLTVTDNIGQTDMDSVRIFLNNTPPVVDITSFDNGDFYTQTGPTLLPLQASVFDAEHSNSILKYAWQTALHHNIHNHPESIDTNRITQTLITPDNCFETFFYVIYLTVTDPEGLSTTVSDTLWPACGQADANFSAVKRLACKNTAVAFNNLSDQATNYTWYFQGGIPDSSTLKRPAVTYPNTGKFDVKLIARNGLNSDTLLFPDYITIYNTPTSVVSPPSPVFYCIGTSRTLKVATNAVFPTYQWRLNGVNIAGTNVDSLVVSTAGNYRAVVTDDNGCSRSSSLVNVKLTPANSLTTVGSTQICQGDSVIFNASFAPNYSYVWYRDNVIVPGANTSQLIAKTAGSYYAVITDISVGCSRTTRSIRVRIVCKEGDIPAESAKDELGIYPNPVSDLAVLEFALANSGPVNILVTDATGRLIQTENLDEMPQGDHRIDLDFSKLEAGLYTLTLVQGEIKQTSRFVVLRN